MAGLSEYELKDAVKHDLFLDPGAADVVLNPDKVLLLEQSCLHGERFTKTSNIHGRNVQDALGLVIKQEPLSDENGDVYTTFTIKGAEAVLPLASYNPIEHSYVRVNGMLDASTFTRCYEASKLLRSEGVLTEWPIFHARPKLFPDGEGDIGLLEFKKMIYKNYFELNEARAKNGSFDRVDSIGQVGLVGAGLLDMQFGVMYRAMLSNARLGEIDRLRYDDNLETHVSAAIRALQMRRPEHFLCWTQLEKLNPDSETDQDIYLSEVLPRIMGENLARFHDTGSYHKYSHGGNWTLAGEIVDLDSVRNPRIFTDDEDEVNVRSRMNEVFFVEENMIFPLTAVQHKYTDPKQKNQIGIDMVERFREAYFAQRWLEPTLSKFEKLLLETHHYKDVADEVGELGDPAFVDVEDDDLTKIISQGFHLAVEAIPDDPDPVSNLFDYLLQAGLEEYVENKADKLLADNGFTTLPQWFNKQRFVSIETLKVTESIAKSIEEQAA